MRPPIQMVRTSLYILLFFLAAGCRPGPDRTAPVQSQDDATAGGARKEVKVDESILQRYVGNYKLLIDSSHQFTISVQDGHLLFSGAAGNPVPFYPESDTLFFRDTSSAEILYFKRRGDYYNMVMANEKGYRLEARRMP